MHEKSKVEIVAGGFATNLAANTVGIFGATITPLAAFIPFLVQTLASNRQSQRLEKMFNELNTTLTNHKEKLEHLSDDQYKLVNEALSAAFFTIDEEKIALLKKAIISAINRPEASSAISDVLSRVIRDISVDEARFVLANSGCSKLFISSEEPVSSIKDGIVVEIGSKEETLVSGLIALGLLYSKMPTFGGVRYEWSPLAERLVNLLKD